MFLRVKMQHMNILETRLLADLSIRVAEQRCFTSLSSFHCALSHSEERNHGASLGWVRAIDLNCCKLRFLVWEGRKVLAIMLAIE